MNGLANIENMSTEQINAMQEQLNIARFKTIERTLEKIDRAVERVDGKIEDFKNDLPLLGVECDKVTVAVRKKGVECLGGKKSNAYKDASIRGKVYADIYGQVKREFGVGSYKAIKRNQVDAVVALIESYVLPSALFDAVEGCNNQIEMDKVV
jgi:hypothetical protein